MSALYFKTNVGTNFLVTSYLVMTKNFIQNYQAAIYITKYNYFNSDYFDFYLTC